MLYRADLRLGDPPAFDTLAHTLALQAHLPPLERDTPNSYSLADYSTTSDQPPRPGSVQVIRVPKEAPEGDPQLPESTFVFALMNEALNFMKAQADG